MKTIKLILLLFAVNILRLVGQHLPDELISSPVFIEHSRGTGTGFFIQDTINMFFVTARHNFIDPNNGMFLVNETTLTTYKEDPVTGDKIIFKIDLKIANSNGLIITKPTVDVLIIKMADLQSVRNGKFAINYNSSVQKLTKSSFIDIIPIDVMERYDSVHIGDDIFLFGYPTSIGLNKMPQFDFTRPLLRKGIVAGKYDANKTLILDCPSYPGNSGGPVIAKLDQIFLEEYKLVGLVVQFIPYEEQWVNMKSGIVNTDIFNSGYSVAVSASKILELLNKK